MLGRVLDSDTRDVFALSVLWFAPDAFGVGAQGGEPVLAKLVGPILRTKATALPGTLILAGALVTSSAQGAPLFDLEEPAPSPVVSQAPDPSAPAAPSERPAARPEDQKRVETAPAASCAEEAATRDEARAKVRAAFEKYHAGLADLRGQYPTGKAETIARADAMLKQVAEYADRILADMGSCPVGWREESAAPKPGEAKPADEDEDDEDDDSGTDDTTAEATAVATIATHFDGDALTMRQVAERAVAAMETIYNLAKSAATSTPPSAPVEKTDRTEKPREKNEKAKQAERSNPTRTPGCDDGLYAAKKVMSEAFDRFHGANDKLYHEIKTWAGERTVQAVKSADQTMHSTYDSTKERIFKAGCSEGTAVTLATVAADVFERSYESSRSAVSAAIASRTPKPQPTPKPTPRPKATPKPEGR